ncbi:CDP-alcohol phosphatidyltransferase family protein [Flavobacterium piscis]|uniref:Phosphatidylglycerophosphate synthase n=1 Tax=Flavobacterium piscis TaxID=1114874 RepID=A0ABU1Y788_9FLAO|nr:CDP-alcohol phosphatidyltransferase family protein [Flavobacterium piscis]MDR7209366.1 phosphatidylglycerophosphate synthase [Flavobacterium piscis]
MKRKELTADWLFYHSILILIGLLVDIINGTVCFCPIAGFFVFLFFLFKNWPGFTEKKRWGGVPNVVTLFRLMLLFVVPFSMNDRLNLAVLGTAFIVLDGVDGFLARRLDQITDFGGQLDMETDAFFCLMFSLLIGFEYTEMKWVLVAGCMRYFYKIVTTIWNRNAFAETKQEYARFFAGCYFVSLVLFFYVDFSFGKYIVAIGNGLVLFSFLISFLHFFKKRSV